MKNIYKTYIDIVKNNGLEIFENKTNEDYFEEEKEKYIIDDENSISSSSNEEESEEIEISDIKNNHIDDDDSDKDNNKESYGDNEKINKNKKNKKTKKDIQYPKNKSKNKSKKHEDTKTNYFVNDISEQEKKSILNVQNNNNFIFKELAKNRPKKGNYITMINKSKKIFVIILRIKIIII